MSDEEMELQDMDGSVKDDEDQERNADGDSGEALVTPKRGASPLMVFENNPTPSPPPGEYNARRSIHQMARDGDIETIRTWLQDDELRKHINDLDEKKLTPLHYAARNSNIDIMKVLSENGADVNKMGDDNMTPLHYAARYGRLIVPKERRKSSALLSPMLTPTRGNSAATSMLEQDAFDAGDQTNHSLLTVVKKVEDKVDAAVEYLISLGADINAKDKYGMTPLHHTAIRGNKMALQRLLKSPGIIKEPIDAQKSTPLHLAATYNQPVIAKMLLADDSTNPRALDGDLRTPLHEACQEGNVSVAKILLESAKNKHGASVIREMTHDRDDDGATPLLLGVGKGGTSIVKLLLSYRANPNHRNKENVFPVHSAARTGDLATLTLLYQNGAIINCLNSLHQTPLYLAAENNNLDVINYLLDCGANVDKWSINGITPVMIAAMEGHAEAVELLIAKGAKLDIYDKDDKSVLFHAAEENKTKALEVLLGIPEGKDLLEIADMYDNLPIHAAAREGHLESVKLLLAAESPIDRKNEDEQCPIHLASIHGRIDIVEEILKHDRNEIMNEDEDSNTPLHLACINKKYKTAEILLHYGADVHNRNAKKWTPLDCAASVGATGCAQLLLDAHAPVDPLDRTNTTPLHLAAENGHSRMIELLLANGADITIEDSQSRNALERAILNGKKKCVTAILDSRDWKKAMRTTHPSKDLLGTIVPETPMRMLIKTYPDLAEHVFNQCIERSAVQDPDDPTASPKKRLIMSYEFIDDAFLIQAPPKEGQFFRYCPVDENDVCVPYKKLYNRNSKVIMDNHPLITMANEEQRNLLRHPLCLGLVRRKWLDYGRYLYYSSLFIYLLFLAFLTSFALLTPNAKSNFVSGQRFCDATSAKKDESKSIVLQISQIAILIIAPLSCFFELVQFFRTGLRYIQWKNLFDWIVYIMSILLVIDVQDTASVTGIRTCWQWQMIAVNLTLAWLNLLGDVRHMPFLGIYVIMFFDILKTFLRFAIVFLIFIVAFGLGFHLLLINQTPFQSVHMSLLKTFVMMTGEFEYEGIFHPEGTVQLEFPALTFFFFLVFVVIMSIIVVNLLIGLAVDDIKSVQEQAILKRLAMQVELVLDAERLLPGWILRRLQKLKETINPKPPGPWSLFKDVVSRSSIIKDASDLETSSGRGPMQLLQVIESLNENVKQLKSEVKSLTEENNENRKLLTALADRNSIYMDDFESISIVQVSS